MSKPFCMNLWLVIPEKVRYNRKKDISKPVISGEFRCVSAEKKAGHAPGGNLRMTGFDCTKKKWGFLRMSTESKTRMTEGSISKKMILFAIPLFLGNLFQQLYNTADSLIVGNFLGSNALAAVSSSGNLIFLMVGFINGIAMGAGVVIARYYGAKNREDLQKAIHTTVAFGLAAGAALTVLGMYLAPKILVLMGTPSDVLPQSVEYFRTYFAGSLGFIMYNIFVGILQSVGDSRHPLIYLIVSSCINVVLDLLFIGGLGMGVGAAALATVISQFTSAILCMIHLLRTKEEYRLSIRKIRFDGRALGEIIRNGVPSGFQNSVISIANVFVQTNINAFGKMAMPLFLGNLFQQLYNTADSLIVGNFLGSNALAAVSSSGNLIFLMVGFINGIAMGAGVVIARYYGAKNREDLQKAIHTTVAFGLAAGAALTVLGMYLAPKILVLMGTPSDVLPQSVEYFRTYFAGSLGFIMYNIFVGILQSVGDSRHPLIYLIVSSCINVALDLLFIGGLGLGVGAAALATVISQFTSAILCMIHLLRTKEEYRLSIRKIRFDGRVLGEIIRNGVPSGFQNSVISIANVFVQTNINAFGKMAMAGCGSYAKIEGFAFLPVTCFTMALTTFVSQNLGAKQYDRAKKGARFGILCSITIAELIGFVIYAAAPTLIAAFNSDPAVVHYGVMQARTIALFYFLLAFSHCIAAVLRGSGHAAVPMVVMLCVWCLFRVSYITVTVRLIQDIRVIFWAYPLTWSISSVIFLYLFLKGKWVYGFEKGGKQR